MAKGNRVYVKGVGYGIVEEIFTRTQVYLIYCQELGKRFWCNRQEIFYAGYYWSTF